MPTAYSLQPRANKAFTLNEVMMTVIIVGILASIAIPSYRKTIERGYHRTAQDLLMAIYNGERAYYFTNDNIYYQNPLNRTSGLAWRNIYVDNPNIDSIPVDFTVGPNGLGFTATATRSGQETISINQNREWCGNPACTSTATSCADCSWQP